MQQAGWAAKEIKRVSPYKRPPKRDANSLKKTRSDLVTIGYTINDRADAQSKTVLASPYWLRQVISFTRKTSSKRVESIDEDEC